MARVASSQDNRNKNNGMGHTLQCSIVIMEYLWIA